MEENADKLNMMVLFAKCKMKDNNNSKIVSMPK
jgi:hypothetical protein